MLTRSLAALGMPGVVPEPEVAKAQVGQVYARLLAATVAQLVNDNEPLLRAEADGATVTVRERGGPAVMKMTVETL